MIYRKYCICSFEMYNPTKNKWAPLKPMMTKRAGTCVVAVKHGEQYKLVAMGGVAVDQQPLDCVEIFDMTKKHWEKGAPMKEKLLGLSAVVTKGIKVCLMILWLNEFSFDVFDLIICKTCSH